MTHDRASAIYNGLILPALLGGCRVLSPFVPKIRDGLRGRVGLIERATTFRRNVNTPQLIFFHCASAGEFESLRPLAKYFDRSKTALAVGYFSPSAKTAVAKSDEFDFADFSPIDSRSDVGAYLDVIEPSAVVITKHDVWPNLIWECARRGIPRFLVNGNFHSRSLKMLPFALGFHQAIYREFSQILAVSEEDMRRAAKISGRTDNLSVAGDSRYDAVVARASRAVTFPGGLEDICRNRKVLIVGSSHREDEDLLIPIINNLKKSIKDLLVIIVPHDSSPAAKRRICSLCKQHFVKCTDLDSMEVSEVSEVLLINRGGILADLYRLGHVALVGGAFGKGVHSVIEPMANGLPVVCGPNISVSHEARSAKERNLLTVVENRGAATSILSQWLAEVNTNSSRAMLVRDFVNERTGASKIIAGIILRQIHAVA